ncbi:MAG: WD40/YVTN/BNR-like repeat-containing protein, partial [Terriglobales bacterium]
AATEALHFHYLGPKPGGRIASATGVPGNPNVYYLGSSSGGVWKSTDGGHVFKPVFDKQDALAIGALAVSPSDPKTVWAGTGEAWAIRGIDVIGDGVYKSTNAGSTWQHMGLEKTGRIAHIVVNPTDANTVFVCALGQITGPSQQRGVYKTTDGGKTWKRTLFVNPYTGCSGLAIDPHDPNTLLAGTWQVLMHSWGEFSGILPGTGAGDAGEADQREARGEAPALGGASRGSGVYISHDGGDTWTHITQAQGMPKPPLGKIDVAIAPSNPQRMFALIQTPNQGSLWRSDNGGTTWKDVNWNRTLIGRAGYYIRIAVDPFNENNVLITNSSFHRSLDGGHTFDGPATRPQPGQPRLQANCGDCHDIWMDPDIKGRYILTDDAGASIATGKTVLRVTLPNGQLYHVATDNQTPYWVYTDRQDNGTMRGPSNGPEGTGNGLVQGVPQNPRAPHTAHFGGFSFRRPQAPPWQYALGGCESSFIQPEPHNPNVVWASCYADEVTRYDALTGVARSVSPWMHTLDSPPNKLKYRCQWAAPLAVDPIDGSVYYGCQVVFHTTDGGQSWQVISPDLSQGGAQHLVSSGGLVGDNLGQFYGDLIIDIAPSPIDAHLIWAGTNDGQLWYTKGGQHWVDVAKNIHGAPANATIDQIAPSSFDPGTAYVVLDAHLENDRNPYLFKTNDYGQTWTNLSAGFPHGNPLDYLRSIAENPNRKGMLFAGSGHGFFYSMNDGATWTQFNKDLPAAPVNWITVQKRAHDVLVATYGRGLYVLPDITMFEQTGKTSPLSTTTRLFRPRDGIRMPRNGHAAFDFSLAPNPTRPLALTIHDASGTLIRILPVHVHGGLNQVRWDLRYTAPQTVKLRTTPKVDPYIWSESRFYGQKSRPVEHWGIEQAERAGPLAAPGNYTVSFTYDGKTWSQPFAVVKDPAISSSDADLTASTTMQIRVRNDMDEAVKMINHLETMRKQVQDDLKTHPDQKTALDSFETKLMNVEMQLLNHESLLSDDKYYPEQFKVYMNLIWFNGEIGTGAGDVAGGADYKPTDVSYTILAGIEKKLAAAKTAYDGLLQTALPAFNHAMAGRVPAIH